jgi:hypothetical protein
LKESRELTGTAARHHSSFQRHFARNGAVARENGAPDLVESLWWTRITPIERPIFEPMRRIAAPALNIRGNLYLAVS